MKTPAPLSCERDLPSAAQLSFGRRLGQLVVGIACTVLVAMPGLSPAAPLTLTDYPLFISNTVQPNIFYMLDDSGSMDWEFVYNDGTGEENGWDNNNIFCFTSCPWSSGFGLNPTSVNQRLFMCPGYNTLAYDPNATYTPWQGKDDASVTYQNAWLYGGGTDASPNYTVRNDPYLASGTTIDLAAAGVMAYWAWNDADSDGWYDAGECGDTSSNTGGITFASRTDAQKKNFANWYVYYRKREFVAKRAVSELVKNSQARVGLSTLHRNNSVGRQIETIDDLTTPVNATAATNKQTLLNHVSRINSSGGTPLRTALNNVGRYYEGISQTALFGSPPSHTGTVSSLSPVLSATNGGECQQNFSILMTDGYYNSGYSGTNVGNADGNKDTAFDSTSSGSTKQPYGDGQSNTLADIAMHYYERDLHSILANKVPVTLGVDDASHQHMVTFTVAFGLSGNLDPFGTKTTSACDTDPTNSCFNWPEVSPGSMEDTPNAVDDLWHAGYDGRGKFLSAKSPTTLSQALSDAINAIDDRSGSAASVAVNSRTLNTDTRIYQATFTSGEWSGNLRALPVGTNGAVGTELWNAKDKLKTQAAGSGWDTGRTILTWNATAGAPFRWASLSASQQGALDTNPTTGVSDSQGAARLNYLRGDSANEGTGNNYRVRKNGFKLGDIVDSGPIYVGAPPFLPDYLGATSHSAYRAAKVSRTPMIYVGANDGMLHGFDEVTGQEKLAYVPGMLYSQLNFLTSPNYAHRYYVNASPTVGDAFFGGAWHTMLVSGLGKGGKGYFALDVSDPASFTESNAVNIVKWEFTDAGTPADMGYGYGQPTITKMQDGTWRAIFGNGYNSADEQPVLYLVDISDPTNFTKIVLESTTGGGNGLSTPAVVDKDGDYIADYVFAGDLKGNMWKVDVTGNNASSWGSYYKSGTTPKPLFKASDAGAVAQPITERPEIGDHPDSLGGFMVYFGTGKYLEDGDKAPKSSPVNTFYGVWDKDTGGSGISGTAAVLRSELLAQTLNTGTVGSTQVRFIDPDNTIDWKTSTSTGTHLGWRVDLNITGEMSVSNPVLVGGGLPRIIFTTLIPETAASCGYGGQGWLLELNPRNGGRFSQAIFDIDGDGNFTSADMIGGKSVAGINPGIGILPEPVIIRDTANKKLVKALSGSTGAVMTNQQPQGPNDSGRRGWRQLR